MFKYGSFYKELRKEQEITQKFFRDFKQNHSGFIDCKDLLAENAKTGNPKKTHCDALVFEVVEYIEKLVEK